MTRSNTQPPHIPLGKLKALAARLSLGAKGLIGVLAAPFRRWPVFTAGVVALVMTVGWYWDWDDAFVSWRKDHYFNPAAEGVIVVDTPQLFTRERLVNERFLESGWIDEQIKKVSQKLDGGEFGRVDEVNLRRLLLEFRGGSADSNRDSDKNSAADQPIDTAMSLLKELGGLRPSPRTAFDEARNYREHLASQRYEAILDDAHDLGANTLHRLNFRLTLQPAASRTDSLAGVSVVVREAFDDSLILESYSKLVVDLRKRLEELVTKLALDRSSIFHYRQGANYSLETNETNQLDSTIERMFENYMGVNGDTSRSTLQNVLSEGLSYIRDEYRDHIARKLKEKFRGFDREKAEKLFAGTWATDPIRKSCRDDYTINGLIAKYSPERAKDIESWKAELEKELAEAQKTQAGRQGEAGTGGSSSRPQPSVVVMPPSGKATGVEYKGTSKPSDSEKKAKNKLEAFKETVRQPFKLQCFETTNAVAVSKIRLIGFLHHLNRLGPEVRQSCRQPEALKNAFAFVLGRNARDPGQKQTPCAEAAKQIRDTIDASGAEIGATGISVWVKDSLLLKSMETTRRGLRLGDLMTFEVDPHCAIGQCSVAVRTKSEQCREEHQDEHNPNPPCESKGKAADSPAIRSNDTKDHYVKANRVGKHEALRLFLELGCFAHARSYTVWPRAGERDSTVGAEYDSAAGGFGLGDFAGTGAASSESIRRNDRNRVFGIGDWGEQAKSQNNDKNEIERQPCGGGLFDVLNEIDVWRDFRIWVEDRIDELGPNYDWFIRVHSDCERLTGRICDRNSGEFIESLARVAAARRKTETSVAWIVAPRTMHGRKQHIPMSLPLSAIVSVPSWWGALQLEVTTCWLRPSKIRGKMEPDELCKGAVAPETQTIDLPLPGGAQEVLQKLGFFILRTPYLDSDQNTIGPFETEREAAIWLTGARLWKNPRVRLGAQWHDSIEVLPDMQGLIATFKCVEPSPDGATPIIRFDQERPLHFGRKPQAPPPKWCAGFVAGKDGRCTRRCVERGWQALQSSPGSRGGNATDSGLDERGRYKSQRGRNPCFPAAILCRR